MLVISINLSFYMNGQKNKDFFILKTQKKSQEPYLTQKRTNAENSRIAKSINKYIEF